MNFIIFFVSPLPSLLSSSTTDDHLFQSTNEMMTKNKENSSRKRNGTKGWMGKGMIMMDL